MSHNFCPQCSIHYSKMFQVCLAFALGLKLFADKHTIKQFVVSLSIFVISCPVGIAIGMIVVEHFTDVTLTQIVFVLKALATGKAATLGSNCVFKSMARQFE